MKTLFLVLLSFILINQSCITTEGNQEDLFIKKFETNSIINEESINLAIIKGIKLPESKSCKLISVTTYYNGNKTYTVLIKNDCLSIISVDAKGKLLSQKKLQ